MASGRSVLCSPQTVRGVCRQRRRCFPGGILTVAAEKSGTVLSLHHQCSNSGRRGKRCVRKCRKRIERDFAPTRSIVLPFLQHGKENAPVPELAYLFSVLPHHYHHHLLSFCTGPAGLWKWQLFYYGLPYPSPTRLDCLLKVIHVDWIVPRFLANAKMATAP